MSTLATCAVRSTRRWNASSVSSGNRSDRATREVYHVTANLFDSACVLWQAGFAVNHDKGQTTGTESCLEHHPPGKDPTAEISHIVTRIHGHLPRLTVPASANVDDCGKTAWKLRGLQTLFDPDADGPYGHRWPANRLTADDMRRLRILSNLSGLPCNALLHRAVLVLFGSVRSAMDGLLRSNDGSEPTDAQHDGNLQPDVPALAVVSHKDRATETAPQSEASAITIPLCSDARPRDDDEPVGAPVLAAEAPPDTAQKRQRRLF